MDINIEESLRFVNVLSETDITTNTTTAGAIIDSDGFNGLAVLVQSGTITDGSYAFKVEHGNDPALSDASDVDLSFLSVNGSVPTTLPTFEVGEDNTLKKIGYVGKKPYVRVSLVSTGVTAGGTAFTSKAVLGKAYRQPVAQS